MDLYLDTAHVSEWNRLMPTGMFTGITTNPLLAARAGLDYSSISWRDLAHQAADLGASELHGQVYGDPETYSSWADKLLEAGAKANLRTVVKVPLVQGAIRTVPALKRAGSPVLMTACYDPKQMFVAAALGADYIAPYFGRMLEKGLPAFDDMKQMLTIANMPNVKTRLLVASLRDTSQMVRLAELGCECFTIAPHIADMLLSDDNTVTATQDFENSTKPH